jgi:hypothetical protein
VSFGHGYEGLVGVADEHVEHVGEHLWIETCVDLGCQSEQLVLVVCTAEHEYVDEVAGRCSVEQGDHFASGQFARVERGSGDAGDRRVSLDRPVSHKPRLEKLFTEPSGSSFSHGSPSTAKRGSSLLPPVRLRAVAN